MTKKRLTFIFTVIFILITMLAIAIPQSAGNAQKINAENNPQVESGQSENSDDSDPE